MRTTTPEAERERVAATTASEWITELLAEPSPEWHTVARLADELRKIAEDARLGR